MNAAKSKDAGAAGDPDASSATAAAPTPARQATVSPSAALARHLEWLDFALAAARSEEAWRVGRLEKATKKSRDKRTTRLAEIREEIAELSALVGAIRDLQARVPKRGRPPIAATGSTRTRKAPTRSPRRRTAAASPTAADAGAASSATAAQTAPPAGSATQASAAPKAPATRTRTTTATTPRTTKPGTAAKRRTSTAKPAAATPRRRRAPGSSSTGPA